MALSHRFPGCLRDHFDLRNVLLARHPKQVSLFPKSHYGFDNLIVIAPSTLVQANRDPQGGITPKVASKKETAS